MVHLPDGEVSSSFGCRYRADGGRRVSGICRSSTFGPLWTVAAVGSRSANIGGIPPHQRNTFCPRSYGLNCVDRGRFWGFNTGLKALVEAARLFDSVSADSVADRAVPGVNIGGAAIAVSDRIPVGLKLME